jgi:HAD superfamily hydrolase (TIGR01549 family)
LFDWDDTLFNMEAVEDEVADQLLKRFNPDSKATGREINALWYQLEDGDRHLISERYFNGRPLGEILKVWDELYETLPLEKRKLLEPAEDVLKALKAKKVPVAIVSNKSRAALLTEISHFRLGKYINVVVSRHSDEGRRKPHHQPIVDAIREMGINLHNIWFVGDSLDDMQAARADGIQRFHIHHSDERRTFVSDRVEHNDHPTVGNPMGTIILLKSLKEFKEHYVDRIHKDRAASLLAP